MIGAALGAGAMLALLALTNAGAGAGAGAALALALALALAGLVSLCSSSCTNMDDEGATPGFLSFFGGSCAISGAGLIEDAIPGFLSFFGGSSAIGPSAFGPSTFGATPGFLSLGTSLNCSCAKSGRG